ncbi:putative ribonuclease H-like domain-containing protein [Tanacetum coccineum]
MDLETAQITTTAKLPTLKQENGNSFKPTAKTTTNVDGTSTTLIPGPVTTEEKVQKKNDMKARSMLLMALPNEHLMTFNQYKDAKTLFAAIQTRFGGFRRLNKPDLDTMSFNDLYNNFKIVEQEVKGTVSSSSSSSSQNMAFVSSLAVLMKLIQLMELVLLTLNQPNGSQLVYEDLEQIYEDDIEEMDLKWQLALLSMRTRRFFQKTSRKIIINGSDTAGYDKSKVDCFNCHKMGHFARECRGPRNQDNRNRNQDSSRRTVNVEETSSKAMLAIDGARSQIPDKSRKGLGFVSYNVVPPPPTGLFSPPNLDLSNSGLEEFQKPKFEDYGPKTSKNISEDTSNKDRESLDAPIVEKLVSDDKLNKKTVFPTIAKIEFLRPKQQEKPVKYVEMYRSQGHPQKEDEGYVDSGCARHMTRNMSYLSDFKEFDRGYVTFGRGAKGWKITGKGTLKTGKLDFEDVYFVKELQFNLFSVSQMFDKKNNVLFTDTGCFVLSPDFKLADESQVLLKVPRKNNMYSVDMKNIIPKESLTCLVAKATLDESIIWHWRLGHVNFKTINKLIKENLVRGLPSKRFENDQNCVACLKGKQHKVSCKSEIQNSITQPLFMLLMDLFGLTFMSSLMNKKYCLVVTDDYSRFTWVFFLASKDETSGILKSFIIEIENLVDKKVKIIIRDNGTKFKNRVISDFCEKKGIKREFSVARTPQQNGIAERRNRTLIKVARTMLADSKLPTTFWVEAVNTACYVQNRVLVVKPHNKTPYKLFRGRTPALSFMRPFGCHVTILNTLDYLGFRVYNIRTRKVEESLHIRFLEDKPIIAGDGPKWLFDIDVLKKSMNYVPLVAGTNSNDFTGTEESIGAGHSSKETRSSQDYILMPLWKDGSLFDSSSKNASNDEPQPSSDAGKKDDEGVSQESGIDDQERPENSTQDVNTVGPSINTEPDMFSLGNNATLEATHADVFGDETEVDMSNISTTYLSSTPNTRIHKDHSLDHVIGEVHSGVQTRRMTKTTNEQRFISAVYEGKTHEDFILVCLLVSYHKLEPKRNKKNERGIVVRNKARLVTQGYTQEEEIDYDEERVEFIYCMARIKRKSMSITSRVFKIQCSWTERGQIDKTLFIKRVKSDILLVQVYVDDIIFGSTKKKLCTEFETLMHKKFQMSSMGELTFFLGLQVMQKDDGIFISQDKYVDEILKKFGFSTVKTTSTPMETSKPLLKDVEAEDVDVHLYRSMIGSLMYLTASRPDIMFVDSPFDLEAYTDSDYAGASLDRKFTIGGFQFLGSRLISWQCKKQTIVSNSTTEAEYVAVDSCCGQVLWIQNQMVYYGYNFMNTKIFIDNESTICIVKNPVFYSKTKHIEIRHHFIRDSDEKKLIQVIKVHTDQNVADLLTKAFDTQKPRKAKRTIEISQSSGPIPLVVDETIIKEWEDRMERAATTASSLEAEQDNGNINRTQSMATLNESFP